MKFVTYNIRYATGRDDCVDLDRIVGEVAGADVIALQEVERFWARSGNVDQAGEIGARLAEYFWVYGAAVDLYVGAATAGGARRQFGNMLLCRAPILYARHHPLPKLGSTDALSIARSASEAVVRCGGRLLRVYSLHLSHLSAADRLPQVEALLRIHADAETEGAPVGGDLRGMDWAQDSPRDEHIDACRKTPRKIHRDDEHIYMSQKDAPENVPQQTPREAILLGDFNFQPASKEYDLLVGARSDYGGRIRNPRGFVDAWVVAGGDEAGGFTSDVRDQPARLDYCFVSNSLRDCVRECWVDSNATGSDHFPLWCEIEL